MTSRLGLAGVFAWALVNAPSLGQQAPPSTDPKQLARFGARVDLVTIDVSVLDRDRLPLKGLTAADFTILEDGRPQAVAAFDEIERPDVAVEERRPGASWLREVAPDVARNDTFVDHPLTVIVLDDATPMRAVEVLWVQRMARATIERLPPGDSASVVFALDKKSGQDFTTDRARLLAAVQRFNGSADRHLNENGELKSFDQFNGMAQFLFRSAIDTVRALADALADLPGRRKAIVFISVGVPLGTEEMEIPENLQESVGQTVGGTRLLFETFQMYRAAQHANTNVYAISPGGLRSESMPDPKIPSNPRVPSVTMPTPSNRPTEGKLNDLFLEAISTNTGGFALTRTNDFEEGIDRIYRENSSYYLLGYTPVNGRRQGRFRRLQVRVNRPDVTVRARTGYFEPLAPALNGGAPRASPARGEMELNEALAGLVAKSDLPMQLAVAPFAIRGQREAAVAIVLAVQQQAPPHDASGVQRVELRLSAFSPDGVRRAFLGQQAEVKLTPGVHTDVTYEVLSRLDLPPGRYQLRVAAKRTSGDSRAGPVRSEASDAMVSGQTGSVYYDVDVPDFATEPISLSGVVFNVRPGISSGPKELLASLAPITPTTRRVVGAEEQATAFLRVYQGAGHRPEAIALVARIVDGDGLSVFERSEALSPDRFRDADGAGVLLEIPVAQFKSGSHLLTIVATKGRATASRSLRFDVQ